MPDYEFLIALGGNMPLDGQPPDKTIMRAVGELRLVGATNLTFSRLYRTAAFPAGSGPDFVNAAARLRLDKTPDEMLELLHQIEERLGRERSARWGQRTLDLDLLAAGACILPDHQVHSFWRGLPLVDQSRQAPDQLVLPHPRLQDRAFVLVPLCDVAPDWRHPILARTVSELLSDLPDGDRDSIRQL